MTCPRCQRANRPDAQLCDTCGTPLDGATPGARSYAELKHENDTLRRSLNEAREQQIATAEILRVIASSPSDAQPVFETIARSAVRLCDGVISAVFRLESGQIHHAANHGPDPAVLEADRRRFPLPMVERDSLVGRAMAQRAVLETPDVEDASMTEMTVTREAGRALGFRSELAVPMLRGDEAIGAVAVNRPEPGRFTATQIALLQTFAAQAVIAIENVRLFTELEARNRDLTTALDQQTATSEILRVISSSQTDVQPVFDTILASAVRLLGAYSGSLTRSVGDKIELAALTSTDDAGDAAVRARYPRQLRSEDPQAQILRDRAPLNVADAQTDPRLSEATRAYARARGWRSAVMVPMLRHSEAVGTIALTRRDPGGFTDDEIALLQTFADQAVIAIENVRLFTELQEKNRALTQAHAQVSASLEQQTATSEILRVISSSPTDVQPVFDTIVTSAVQLCGATYGAMFLFDGQMISFVAHHNLGQAELNVLRRIWPRRPEPNTTLGTVILTREVLHVRDLTADHRFTVAAAHFTAMPIRTLLGVPMLRGGEPIGVIGVYHTEVAPFSDRQIELVKTFADQAVIAIENVRLFKELEARNRDLTEALDRQTATADILRVISQAQTDVQPVFDAILASALRLLGGASGSMTRIVGGQLELAALTSIDDSSDAVMRATFPRSLQSRGTHAQAVRDRAPVNIAHRHTDPRVSEASRATGRLDPYQSVIVVPLLRHDEAIGALGVSRREPGGFTDDEIALLQTFADQAVIAIENARLLAELQARTQELSRSVEQLTALGEVGRAVSSTLDLETVLTTIVSRAVQLSGLDGGVVFEYDESAEEFVHRAQAGTGGAAAAARRGTRFRKGDGVIGRTAITLEPIQVSDITVPGAYVGPNRENVIESGIRAILAVPMVRENRLIGCLGVSRNRPGEFPAETIELLRTFATQSALAIQNARLFHEIEVKSRQLELASRHKSEFLANMSHELRTPLNAVIGFSEVLRDRMFGELNEKQDEYLNDIHASGQHLLSLINDILDLSKIEAGRMELELTDFDLPAAIDNALTLVRERAGRHGIALHHEVDALLGQIRGDERKIKQVLLNLLSNAIKFTPEEGRIDVRAALVDGMAEVTVADTGVGIAPEDQEAVFEEFRQVGTANKKVEGTGLGLTLSRKFVELHGGRIWVKSQVGAGSTFTFTIPIGR